MTSIPVLTEMAYVDFSNKTEFALHNDYLRYTWATYNMFILLSSLIGDSTIIIASIKYRAFKLHKFIVAIIQHIAVCDLLVSLVSVFPRVISLMSNNWVFVNTLKYVAAFGMYYFNGVGLFLIALMTTGKLIILKFPLRSRLLTSSNGQFACVAMWILPSSLVIPGIIVGDGAVFDHRTYDCRLSFSANIWRWLKPILVGFFVLTPILLVIVTTVCLLKIAKRFARRGGRSLKWQGMITTILITITFCISILPYSVYTFIAYSGAAFAEDPHSFFSTHFNRAMKSFIFFNTISNFYIYSLTIVSFREFLSTSKFNVCGCFMISPKNAVMPHSRTTSRV